MLLKNIFNYLIQLFFIYLFYCFYIIKCILFKCFKKNNKNKKKIINSNLKKKKEFIIPKNNFNNHFFEEKEIFLLAKDHTIPALFKQKYKNLHHVEISPKIKIQKKKKTKNSYNINEI